MNSVMIAREAVVGTSLEYLFIEAADSWFMDVCDDSPH